MGTYRTQRHAEPCECGAGKYIVDECEPNHSYARPGDEWFEGRIECPRCDTLYEIVPQGQRMVLMARADLEEDRCRRAAASAASHAFMDRDDVRALFQRFAAKLDGLRSKAAVWRYLGSMGFYVQSQSTFTKGWEGGAGWVAAWRSPADVLKVLDALGDPAPDLRAEIAGLEELGRHGPLPVRKTVMHVRRS